MGVLSRLNSRRCNILAGVVALIVVISILFVFSFVHDDIPKSSEILDSEFPLPPSIIPMVVYENAGVVSNGEPCAQIGKDILKNGGNAVDSVIATLICDGVYCPELMGLGGGFLMTLYNATSKTAISINARESAPANVNETMYINDPHKSLIGGLAVAIPGELKGYWDVYNKYGSGNIKWKSLFEPTIKKCEEGIVVSQRLALILARYESIVQNYTELRDKFVDKNTGHVKRAGDTYKLPKLAKSMRIIAEEGGNALYNGSLTAKFIEDIANNGGIITAEDLANYKVEIEETFNVTIKNGFKLFAGPPPGSGVVLAYILRVLDGKLPASNDGLNAQRIIEAFKFAYGERTHLGDKNFVNVTEIFEKIKSDEYMSKIRNKISDNFTSLDPRYYGADFAIPADHGTANVVVLDNFGNAAVATSTLNTYFGSGVVSESTGIILNNEMDDFSTPGVNNYFGIPPSPANFIKPGKRPMSSMCPAVITDDKGNVVLAIGGAGGSKITLSTAFVSSLILWFNKTLKEAVDEPRFYHQLVPMRVDYEYGVLRNVIEKLKEIGHPVKRLKINEGSAVTAIYRTKTGQITAMSDFRRPGNTSGY
ncbi:scoloptoxin SSD14-like isoform X2 [Daktulosphaira vitifoliae]|uniref:scoloptoxin SSD14-like isoform X2 n=1 Tax=Daktulosphaira vitifoliae TaxID=58002 RepID=UPI0021A98341|nr:scoloptoxin SSD14-like isoform X2 [Daktulosphaira vitifoliae]XP_050543878.1 scoloptoxin SSD14-like isoform X2 [Daktulosphaira vitifoliae]